MLTEICPLSTLAGSDVSDASLIAKLEAMIGEQVKAINDNTNQKTVPIKESLTEIKNDISSNTSKIEQVNECVDNVNKELDEMKKSIEILKNGVS